MYTIIKQNKAKYLTKTNEFYATFNLRLTNYWDIITGFNITKFDNDIKCPDGISLKQHIENTFGLDAVALIMSLI